MSVNMAANGTQTHARTNQRRTMDRRRGKLWKQAVLDHSAIAALCRFKHVSIVKNVNLYSPPFASFLTDRLSCLS